VTRLAKPATELWIVGIQALSLELLPRPRPVIGFGRRLLSAQHADGLSVENAATEPFTVLLSIAAVTGVASLSSVPAVYRAWLGLVTAWP